MVCDFLHATYEVDAKLERGSDKLFRVRWYFCAPGAKVLPILSSVTSPTWSTFATDREDFGIKSTSFRKYLITERPPMALGKCYRGRPDQFVFGQLPTDPYPPFTGCCPEALVPPPDQDGGGIDDVASTIVGDLDGASLRDIVSVYGGDWDSGYVFDYHQDGGGEYDSAEESGYLGLLVTCTPAFAPGTLVAEITNPNLPNPFPPVVLLNLDLLTPHRWGFSYLSSTPPITIEMYCDSLSGLWVMILTSGFGSYVSFVTTGTGPPFFLTGFSFSGTLFGALPILLTVRQPTTLRRIAAGGGELDGGSGAELLAWPKFEVDSGGVTSQAWIYGGDVDGGQLSRHDFLFGGEVDGGGPDTAPLTSAAEVDSGEAHQTDAARAGELDGFELYETQPHIITACSPAFVPTALFADVVNPNPSGLASGTYPLVYSVPGVGAWSLNWPGTIPAPAILFFCESPSNTWLCELTEPRFSQNRFLPSGTSVPFSVGPFSFSPILWGPSPVTVVIHS